MSVLHVISAFTSAFLSPWTKIGTINLHFQEQGKNWENLNKWSLPMIDWDKAKVQHTPYLLILVKHYRNRSWHFLNPPSLWLWALPIFIVSPTCTDKNKTQTTKTTSDLMDVSLFPVLCSMCCNSRDITKALDPKLWKIRRETLNTDFTGNVFVHDETCILVKAAICRFTRDTAVWKL